MLTQVATEIRTSSSQKSDPKKKKKKSASATDRYRIVTPTGRSVLKVVVLAVVSQLRVHVGGRRSNPKKTKQTAGSTIASGGGGGSSPGCPGW